MAAQVRVLRQRVKSVKSTQKITKAQELIATSRITKAQARVAAALPYSEGITGVLSELAGAASLQHPLLTERETVRRAGILLVTSDRGLAGGYNANAIKQAEELASLLRERGAEPVYYIIGRKGVGYYTFRQRAIAASWTGFSERPEYSDAEATGEAVMSAFRAGSDGQDEDGNPGIDELHVVSTHFVSMLTQRANARRLAPMEVEYVERSQNDGPAGPTASYEFEPSADVLLDAMLPKYVTSRIYAALLDSAASESAARRAACKSATDNAGDIIRNLSREVNQARQAQITQELSEIVGGADALAAASDDD
jgi:F-type H+-transporting ATPase subunit gamma